jgi:hypothetical protein
LSFGFTSLLTDSTIALEEDSKIRIVIIDIREKYLEIIKKFAVLCLHNYVQDDNFFNIALAGQTEEQTGLLFEEPLQLNSENLQKAYQTIIDLKPQPQASTINSLKRVISEVREGVLILLSDLESGDIDQSISEMLSLFDSTGNMLFTISNNSALENLAVQTGGYSIADLAGEHFLEFGVYYSPEGEKRYQPKLPDLFTDNPHFQGINLVALIPGISVSNLTYTYKVLSNGVRLNVAGHLQENNDDFNMFIKGYLDGHRFLKKIGGGIPSIAMDSSSPNVQWAFRKTEHFAQEDLHNHLYDIKQLGMDYQIVTRNTSLLALEPGMLLWEGEGEPPPNVVSRESDLLVGNFVDAVFANEFSRVILLDSVYVHVEPQYTISNGDKLENLSLNALINGPSSSAPEPVQTAEMKFAARAFSEGIEIGFPSAFKGQKLTLSLYNIQGSLIAQKEIGPTAYARYTWNFNKAKEKKYRGFYFLKVNIGTMEKLFRIFLTY